MEIREWRGHTGYTLVLSPAEAVEIKKKLEQLLKVSWGPQDTIDIEVKNDW